jgi:hypothetical protein
VRHQLGVLTHAFSDKLHVLAHRLVGDEDWRMRNGLDPDEVMQVFKSLGMTLGPGHDRTVDRAVAKLGLAWRQEGRRTGGKT